MGSRKMLVWRELQLRKRPRSYNHKERLLDAYSLSDLSIDKRKVGQIRQHIAALDSLNSYYRIYETKWKKYWGILAKVWAGNKAGTVLPQRVQRPKNCSWFEHIQTTQAHNTRGNKITTNDLLGEFLFQIFKIFLITGQYLLDESATQIYQERYGVWKNTWEVKLFHKR